MVLGKLAWKTHWLMRAAEPARQVERQRVRRVAGHAATHGRHHDPEGGRDAEENGPRAEAVVEIVRDGRPFMIRFSAGTYNRVRAQLRDVPTPTARMRRIRAGLMGGLAR